MNKNFVKETKSELKKVIWPSRQDVSNGTGVVIVMVAIVGVIILGFDFFSGWVIKSVMSYNPSSISQSIDDGHNHDENTDNSDVIPENGTDKNQNDVVSNGDEGKIEGVQ